MAQFIPRTSVMVHVELVATLLSRTNPIFVQGVPQPELTVLVEQVFL
jgi:hypothetical protein